MELDGFPRGEESRYFCAVLLCTLLLIRGRFYRIGRLNTWNIYISMLGQRWNSYLKTAKCHHSHCWDGWRPRAKTIRRYGTVSSVIHINFKICFSIGFDDNDHDQSLYFEVLNSFCHTAAYQAETLCNTSTK